MRPTIWLLALTVCACTAIRPLDGETDAGSDGDAGERDAAAPDAAARDAAAADAGPNGDAGDDAGGCAGTDLLCIGNDLHSCNGGVLTVTPCPVACGGSPAACQELAPSNMPPEIGLSLGSADLTVTGTSGDRAYIFNTDSGEIANERSVLERTVIRSPASGDVGGIYFERVPGTSSEPPLGVFVMGSLTIPAGELVLATGDAALVILARDEVQIDGELAADASRSLGLFSTIRGPAFGGRGAAGGGDGTGMGAGGGGGTNEGGGGGGFGRGGGAGGAGALGATAGSSYGNDSLVPLVGGSGGGGGGVGFGGSAGAGRGGAGAGAVQISAGRSLTVGASGRVSACGDGGQGGGGSSSTPGVGGGGGGGSGGAILLESPTVAISGQVGANGGAGGQGAVDSMSRAMPGRDGSLDAVPAMGSSTSGTGGGGGDGSDRRGAPSDGGSSNYGGGGGGGPGRIRINNLAGSGAYTTTPVMGGGSTVGMIGLRTP